MAIRILTLCGSLRARSSNRSLLRAYARLAPANLAFEHYDRIGTLPHFNPDADGEDRVVPLEVQGLRRAIRDADAIVISTPEYVHALPGAFKNALDWLVSDPAVAGKVVVILHVTRGSTWALDSLREVLRTMSTRILERASLSLPLGSNQLDEDAILARPDCREPMVASLNALSAAIEPRP